MQYIHMFQWNIPAENQWSGQTDRYLNIIAKWNGEAYFNDGRPMVFFDLVNPSIYTCMQVKNWYIAEGQIMQIAESHFGDLAKHERINQARAILTVEENPVLNRYEEMNSLIDFVIK